MGWKSYLGGGKSVSVCMCVSMLSIMSLTRPAAIWLASGFAGSSACICGLRLCVLGHCSR